MKTAKLCNFVDGRAEVTVGQKVLVSGWYRHEVCEREVVKIGRLFKLAKDAWLNGDLENVGRFFMLFSTQDDEKRSMVDFSKKE